MKGTCLKKGSESCGDEMVRAWVILHGGRG